MILAKTVCNLRNYYRQGREETIKLIQDHFNPKASDLWSAEAIGLVWDLVEPFTPSLGLRDEKALAKQNAERLEDMVVDLIAWTSPGGRVLDQELLKVFRDWNPECEVTGNAFSRAVKAVTGMGKVRSHGKDYWVGFHVPTPVEISVRAA